MRTNPKLYKTIMVGQEVPTSRCRISRDLKKKFRHQSPRPWQPITCAESDAVFVTWALFICGFGSCFRPGKSCRVRPEGQASAANMANLRLLFLFLFGFIIGQTAASLPSVCPSPHLLDAVLSWQDQCMHVDFAPLGSRGFDSPMVTELDEISLEDALDLLQKRSDTYVSVLFYASWCPFSEICRPVFDELSSMFPTIYHVAVEESNVRPSVLSRHGVHSFPSLFLQNQNSRVRYHGPRERESLVQFYKNITGIEPDSLEFLEIGHRSKFGMLGPQHGRESKENCPYLWAKSPEKLLQQDTYLMLAVLFLGFRVFYFLFPILASWVKCCWRSYVWHVNVTILRDSSPIICRSLKFWNKANFREGAMNARVWATTSLASVSLSEGSSRRSGS